ncbi:hypothetical protein [Kribbella speibonae]|nr:hypothetical protein [Kribbella speibonae]
MRVMGGSWGVAWLEDRTDTGTQFLAVPVEFEGAAAVDDAPEQVVLQHG